MTKKPDLKTYVQDHLLVGDGAMATWLYQQGIPIGVCYEELCLSKPELIRGVHREYYAAGARLIETNTFGAKREALARYGLEHLVSRINWKAAVIAREAVGEDAYIVGSISSVSAGRVRDVQMRGYREQFEEQASALLTGGVDGLILETFLDLEELLLALDVIRPLTTLPILAQLACLEVGRTRDGYTLTDAFSQLQRAGTDVVGLNCRLGPAEMVRSLEQTVVPVELPLSVFPNAGRLGLSEGEYAYKSSPEYFADSARRFRDQGVSIIGGCCGTTPAHIRAIAERLRGLQPVPRKNPPAEKVEPVERQTRLEISGIKATPSIVEKVREQYTVIVEFDPPKDLEIDEYLQGVANLQDAGADAITMADNSLATTRMSNMALGAIIKNKFGIDPLVHIACRDRNLIGQQSHLMGLHALGIHQVLVITGDPARFGDLPGASSVFDVSSFDLIRMVKQLNAGYSFSGKPLKQKAQFVVGAAFNPHVQNFTSAISRLERKIEAGADFIMTQPVYDAETIELIYERTKHLPVPIFIGIMPLTSSRNAEFLHNEVPGIKLTEEALQRMRKYTGAEARSEGVKMARELLDLAMRYFRGIYLITPFSYHDMTAELTRYVREKQKQGTLNS
ncbi:MAG: bifunctional homocysteine S-methyltransferase/methylenetetrahydrofolate reductase [Firmicutes bacterium]|nr:bifunctional homocysteine S-methyltransferase/methylenetetrahydrofolate reductase [Bacillota bacterium]